MHFFQVHDAILAKDFQCISLHELFCFTMSNHFQIDIKMEFQNVIIKHINQIKIMLLIKSPTSTHSRSKGLIGSLHCTVITRFIFIINRISHQQWKCIDNCYLIYWHWVIIKHIHSFHFFSLLSSICLDIQNVVKFFIFVFAQHLIVDALTILVNLNVIFCQLENSTCVLAGNEWIVPKHTHVMCGSKQKICVVRSAPHSHLHTHMHGTLHSLFWVCCWYWWRNEKLFSKLRIKKIFGYNEMHDAQLFH